MSCTRYEDRLDAYVDGELPENERRELEAHLESCADCRQAVEEIGGLVDAAAELPREIEPRRELFDGVLERLEDATPGRTGGRAWVAWAGLAASLVLIAAWWTLRPGDGVPGELPGPAEARPVALSDATDLDEFEREYAEAIRLLTESIEQRSANLSSETREALRRNLEIIDRAIEEIRAALAEDPDSAAGSEMLAAMYQQKIQLLWRVSRLSSS